MLATRLITLSHNATGADAGWRSRLMSLRQMNHCRFVDNWRMASIRDRQSIRKMVVTVRSSVDPVPHLPPNRSPSSLKWWILGVFVSVILPFWRNKWGPLRKLISDAQIHSFLLGKFEHDRDKYKKINFEILADEFEAGVETADHVTEFVEARVEKAEQVAKKVAEHLPDGKPKDWVNKAESGFEVIGEKAHYVEDRIHKVEEVEKAVESFLEPDKINNQAGEISKGTDEQNQKS